MNRRVLSLVISLALCVNLCPVWVLAADAEPDSSLCPHHPAHTEACGYVPPALEQECTHVHDDGCYTTETVCVHVHTAECYPEDGETDEPVLCAHVCSEESGCVTRTLACPHVHDDACGYVAGDPGSPCTYVCQICPIDDLISSLPGSITEANSAQVQATLGEIFDRYDALDPDEQQQVDLTPCAQLLDQLDALTSAVLEDASSDESAVKKTISMTEDISEANPFEVEDGLRFYTNEFTYTGTGSSALLVLSTGELYLAGRVDGKRGVGIEVQPGGFLSISQTDTYITGSLYALSVASGAEVSITAGRFFGKLCALLAEDGDYAALLAPGCAYFDEDGNPLSPDSVASLKTVIVGACTDHSGKEYTHTPGKTEHSWTCPYCGTTETEQCTFTFDSDGHGTCVCGNTLTIAVDEDALADLVYDGTLKPEAVAITVTLTDGSGTVLSENSDYKVDYQARTDAGEITLTVTGLTFHGTFTKTYQVSQDRPVLEWDSTDNPIVIRVNYDGSPVDAGDLPPVKINIKSDSDNLEQFLQYSYKKTEEADYTDGLPTNAGTYEVVVSLPEMQNFQAAVSSPITLIIQKISPLVTAPVATQPVFNGTAQALVTAGTLHHLAAQDGVELTFASNEHGPYTTDIPTGINAGDYVVWYQTEETENFLAVSVAEVQNVLINRKAIKPYVTLSEYTYLYDGGEKEPKVTVKDEDDETVLLDTEYSVSYANNRNVGTAAVTVTDKSYGNYALETVTVNFKITYRTQDSLSITKQPDTVTYGDKFTLGTSGGSGNGEVTWEITAGKDVAEVGEKSGQVTVIGDGTFTVKATKSGQDPGASSGNYEDATATWTIDADKKPVTATVTADDKFYDGSDAATIHAVVEQGVLADDEIVISNLTGMFSDENAGVDKTVKVDTSQAEITGKNSGHYEVSYSSPTVTATIHKKIVNITSAPQPNTLAYTGAAQALLNTAGLAFDVAGVQVEYAWSKDGDYSTDIPEATHAGSYTVWYRVKETPNYTGLDPVSVTVEVKKKPVVTPTIELSGSGLQTDLSVTPSDYYIYDGNAKEPVVTLKDGGTTIPDGEYTVAYSGNVDAGTATVTVTAKEDGNYSFSAVAKDFAIRAGQAKVVTAPKEAGDPLTYNTQDQELVLAGTGSGGTMVYSLDDAAMNGTGTYSTDIPTAANAGSYTVYYKVAGDNNHTDSAVGQVVVTIAPKPIQPLIELSDSFYVYDGAKHEPKITVWDGGTVVDMDQYTVVWTDENNQTGTPDMLTNVGTYTATISENAGKNYTFTPAAATVTIVSAAQDSLHITGQPAQVHYGDTIETLNTIGGTGEGTVKWSILNAGPSTLSTINQTTGELTVKDTGTLTVKAERSVPNYGTVSDTWTFTVMPKPVVADVTVTAKPYDGNTDVVAGDISATVKTSDLVDSGDGFAISGLTGTYDNPNAGTGKTVTLNASGASTTADTAKYTVSYPDTVKADITPRTVNVSVVLSGNDLLTDTNGDYYNYDGTEKTPNVTATGTDAGGGYSAVLAPSDYTVSYADNKNVGTATVTVKSTAGGNYVFTAASVNFTIRKATALLTESPQAKSLTYDGTQQELVTVGQASGGHLEYSLNENSGYDTDIPTEMNAGTYYVYYKVVGDGNHEDGKGGVVSVTIKPKEVVSPNVTVSGSYTYDGTPHTPNGAIVVKDGSTVIPDTEYFVSFRDNTDAGTATAVITNANGGNYIVNGTGVFTIAKAAASVGTDPVGQANLPYNGTAQALATAGSASGGTMVYSLNQTV